MIIIRRPAANGSRKQRIRVAAVFWLPASQLGVVRYQSSLDATSMLATIRSAALVGIDAYDVWVEVDASTGLPQWTLVGLPLGAVKESRERVGAAIVNSGFALPPRRITINLAPADVRKDGTAFDLPIALGILAATGQVENERIGNRIYVGELGLDGQIRPVRGALSIARHASAAGVRELVLPPPNVTEAARVSVLSLGAPPTLRELVNELSDGGIRAAHAERPSVVAGREPLDFSDVVGQETAKRALEVAAAGGHNLLMIGPPGAGKTMLARRVPGILPLLTEEEALEVIAIHSVAGLLTPESLVAMTRPFRAPHHSISSAGLIGGGSSPRPGEVSLAHNGVLFLDEMFEFPRSVLDGLRQPMEDGRVTISRVAGSVKFPARFTLIGATNPCPCGKLGDSAKLCTCSVGEIERYGKRVSGPLSDRIDMHVGVGAVALRDLSSAGPSETTCAIRGRVHAARRIQVERYASTSRVTCNAHASGRAIDTSGAVTSGARSLLENAAAALHLSARGYHRVIKVARTVADLDGSGAVEPRHVAEALRYRPAARA
jgi:magnesium chelatase family protein